MRIQTARLTAGVLLACAAFVAQTSQAASPTTTPSTPSTQASTASSLEAEQDAAFKAAKAVQKVGPVDITLRDQAHLHLPAGYVWVPTPAAAQLMRSMGNRTDDTFVGAIFPADDADWMAVVKFVKEGYIKDDDAKDWNADDLLKSLKEGTEAARLPRFGLHPTSHLVLHEEQAFSALLGLQAVPIGDRLRPMRAADLQAVPQPLACAVVELPIRESGGQLPQWDELLALQALAQQRGIPLHLDGARLWESAAFYQRPHAEIAAAFESVYVSVYKGLGGLSGALLAGSADFVAQARLWRRRLGGTLYHLSPMLVSAAMRFDERLALMPALYQRTLSLAAGLGTLPGLRPNPRVPHTNLFHLHFDAPAEAVLQARDTLAEREGCWLFGHVRDTEVPGWSATEFYVGDRLLQVDDATVLPLFERFAALLKV